VRGRNDRRTGYDHAPVLERALAVDGLTKQSELELLLELARGMPAGAVVVEVGSYRGRSTLAIAEGLEGVSDAKLVAVDTFAGDRGWTERPTPEEARATFDRNTAEVAFLEVLQAESVAAARQVADSSVDWVFIDALHDYRSVVADIRAWAPKVKPSGLFSGHDWGRHDVTDAVLRFFPLDEVEAQHHIWMTRSTPRLRPGRVLKNQAKRLLHRT
jgi:predicted O-methyltransferase YrrM